MMTPTKPPERPSARRRFFTVLDGIVYVVIGAALCAELLAVLANIIGRTFFHNSILWTDEVAGLVLAVLAFPGGAIAYRHGQHSAVQTIVNALPFRYRRACNALTDWLIAVVSAVTAVLAVQLLTSQMGQTTPILGIPSSVLVAPLVIGMLLMVLYALDRLVDQHRPTAILTGIVTIALAVAIASTRGAWGPAVSGDVAIVVALVLFLATVLIGLPVGFALLLSAMVYLVPTASTPMVALPQNMDDGLGFVLLALPFFIFAGAVMEQGGISARLVDLARALVGHLRGGLLQVTVLSIYLVSGLSGSKAADVAAVGPVMRTMLEREGVRAEEGAAVLAASAAMGETIPPSLGLLVLGSITSLSMGALFTAGIVPAAVIAVCLMTLIGVRATRMNMPHARRASAATVGRSALAAVLPLLMPVMLYVGIRTGAATPTEISAVAVAYGLILSTTVYRAFGVRDFGRMIARASSTAGMILFILATATAFSWVLSAAQVPQALVATITSWHAGPIVFLMISVVMLVLLGSLLEGLPAVLILAPLLLPLASSVGLDQLHYAIVLLIAIGIGAFLPPLGVGFYVCCSVAGTTIGSSARVMWPYAGVLIAGLLIVAFVPWFTLALPHAFAPHR
ncbi:MAG: TRAP transporter large permease subunit [Vulcanimicrobiaceae bacterium]